MDTTTDTIVNQQAGWFTFVACNADLFSTPSVLHCVYWGDGVEGVYRQARFPLPVPQIATVGAVRENIEGLVDILPEQFALRAISYSPAE